MLNTTRSMRVVFDEVFFFQIRNCNMLYYELQALLQHNCNLAVAYLALVAMKAVFDEVFFKYSCYSDMIATQNCNLA